MSNWSWIVGINITLQYIPTNDIIKNEVTFLRSDPSVGT